MKIGKVLPLFLTGIFISCNAYALTPYHEQLEKREKQIDKIFNKNCKHLEDIDTIPTKEAILCLQNYIIKLETTVALNQEYYENTLELMKMHYYGALKNTRK